MKAHGEIIHHPTGRVSVYHVRRLGAEDIEDLLHMQMIVEAQVQEKTRSNRSRNRNLTPF